MRIVQPIHAHRFPNSSAWFTKIIGMNGPDDRHDLGRGWGWTLKKPALPEKHRHGDGFTGPG
jgi:hypothetical protein